MGALRVINKIEQSQRGSVQYGRLEDAKEDRLSGQLLDRVSSEDFCVIPNLRPFGILSAGSRALGSSERTSRTASSYARSRRSPWTPLLGDAGLGIKDTPSTWILSLGNLI